MTHFPLFGTREREKPRRIAGPGPSAHLARAVTVLALVSMHCAATVPVYLVRRVLSGRAAARQHYWERLLSLVQRLGPTFVKFGQILSTRRDELPSDLCNVLARLQDDVDPLPPVVAQAELSGCYGSPLSGTFCEIDLTPIASGSVASVYRARTGSGKDVAVKLRRPRIDRVMAADLALARAGARLLARLPVFRNVAVVEVMENIGDAIEMQLDFAREADCLDRIADIVSTVPRVWVPRPVRALCRENVVVMDYIPDLSRDAVETLNAGLRRRLAETTLTATYTMLFIDGFVHCDMHPGNLYFRRSGQVVILDAGFSVQLSQRMRSLFAEFFLEMAWGRSRRCAEIVLESATNRGPPSDHTSFLEEMADLARRNHNLPASQFSLIAFAGEMFDLHRRHGLRAAPELVFPLLALLVIEGIVRKLDPDIDFQETAKPVLTRAIFSERAAPASHQQGG